MIEMFEGDDIIDEDDIVYEDEAIPLEEPDLKEKLRKLRSAVGKRSKAKGSRYESHCKKYISAYFGMAAEDSFISPKNDPKVGQASGDIIPIKKMAQIWYGAQMPPIECKCREEWAFSQFLNDDKLDKNPVYLYWLKSNEDCGVENSLVIFSKNHVVDYVFYADDGVLSNPSSAQILFSVKGKVFHVQTLKAFLLEYFPRN